MSRSKGRERLRRALGFVRPSSRQIAIILALTLSMAGMNAVEPLVLKLLFDNIETGGTVALVIRYGALFLSLALLREGISTLSNSLTWRTRLKLHYRVLEAVVGRLHHLPISYYRSEGVGAIMTRIDRGIQGFVGAFAEVAFSVVPTLVYLVISLNVMFRLEWRLALVALVFVPLPPIIAALSAPEQARRERTLLDRWAHIHSRWSEVLSSITTVKSFVMEEKERDRFLGKVSRANEVVVKGVTTDSWVGAAQNLVVALARVAVLMMGGLLLLERDISLGTLIAFWGYVGGLFGPVQGLSGTYKVLRRAAVSLETIDGVLDAPDYVPDAPGARVLTQVRGDVLFEDLRFSYAPESPRVLDGINLHVPAGQIVAIVGPSGGGKTTLMSLLQRFYDPQQGRILVDGEDIRTVAQQSLRHHIGVVQQEPILFNDTVASNIAYGRPDAPLADIMAAAAAGKIHDFILKLPQGYNTVVGERGGRLSAGERQRLAIARALLRDPPILILDEATSALDAESEAMVQQAAYRLTRGRTAFIIAHRLSSTVMADRILVLRNGRVTESGRHEQLMEADGYYARLVRHQVHGLLLPRAA